MKAKSSKFFTFIEMMVVVTVILILIGLSLIILRKADIKSKIAATLQNIETLNTSVGSYKLDFGVIPLASTVDPMTYTDGLASAPYWNRIDRHYKKVNTIAVDKYNAYIRYDEDNADEIGEIKSNHEFKAKYPFTDFRVPLDSWNIADENMEKISVISQSSRFLNYYLSGTYLDITKKLKYFEGQEMILGDDTTTFRYYKDDSILFVPYKYFKTDQDKLFSITKKVIGEPPSIISQLPGGKRANFTEYVYKSIENINEDNNRRLYLMNDTAEVVPVSGAPKLTLDSDVVIYESDFFGVDKTKSNKPAYAKLHMRAHTKNVRLIVDRFKSPLVYVTFSNQLKKSARTYKDATNDFSIDNNRFVIYSLGPNKRDDCDLAENNLKGTDRLGDDLISSHGKSQSK